MLASVDVGVCVCKVDGDSDSDCSLKTGPSLHVCVNVCVRVFQALVDAAACLASLRKFSQLGSQEAARSVCGLVIEQQARPIDFVYVCC